MLGTLKRVNPREYWKHEEQDFTPWLKENIDKLSEEIGIEIEVEDREVGIGSFSLGTIGSDAEGSTDFIVNHSASILGASVNINRPLASARE